jgi:RNA polymerase sigma factor (TIGR02999 family)
MGTPGISGDLTALLRAWSTGDRHALDALVPRVDEELHRIAKHYLSRERPDPMLQTTVLVNEAYVRLIDAERVTWQDRAHFFAVSAQIMRRLLVDRARARRTAKRGGDMPPLSLDEAVVTAPERTSDLVAIDEALEGLAKVDARKGRVVELRFFGGLSIEETAEVLKISPDTVKRDWKLAKVWLMRELSGQGVGPVAAP